MIFFPTLVSCLYGLRQTPGQVTDFFAVFATPQWPGAAARPAAGHDAGLLRRRPDRRPERPARRHGRGVAGHRDRDRQSDGGRRGDEPLRLAVVDVVVVTLLALVAYSVVELVERRVLRVVAPEQTRW